MKLSNLGWRVLVVWECATKVLSMSQELGRALHDFIVSTKSIGEIAMKEGRLTEAGTVNDLSRYERQA
jgi:G:T-mismatch repair DNA endonuclease (very short patch repair protein)